MHLQTAFRQTRRELRLEGFCFLLATAVHQSIVSIPTPWEIGMCPRHPEDGYRPNKSALDAVGVTRKRCWKYDWILEFDIRGLFDNIDHELLLRAVRKHVTCKWALLYIERWLKAHMVKEDGTTMERNCGTPQGGVVSQILANLFLHYAFDLWMTRTHPDLPW